MIEVTSRSEIKFGERIRAVRKSVGCSQKEFGLLLDIPQPTLSAYETDRMQPTLTFLINIAINFDVSLDWLCGIKDVQTLLSQCEKTLNRLVLIHKNFGGKEE